MNQQKPAADLKLLSQYLDSKFKGPFGIRFGLDSLIGLIPGLGDAFTSILSLYIIARGAMLGVSSPVVLRMTLNTFVDYVFGLVPGLGDLFDLYWKSNNRNYELIEKHLDNPTKATKMAYVYLIAAALLGLLILVTPFYVMYLILTAIF